MLALGVPARIRKPRHRAVSRRQTRPNERLILQLLVVLVLILIEPSS